MDKLTKVEINHLLELLESRRLEESYYGNKEQYEKRAERIKQKLENLLIVELINEINQLRDELAEIGSNK
jgi:hypothetical protein